MLCYMFYIILCLCYVRHQKRLGLVFLYGDGWMDGFIIHDVQFNNLKSIVASYDLIFLHTLKELMQTTKNICYFKTIISVLPSASENLGAGQKC